MNNKELFKAIGEADEKFILDCEKDSGKGFIRFLPAVCAAVILVFSAALLFYNQPQTEPVLPVKHTSEKYANLDELLSYLSENERHNDEDKDRGSAVRSLNENHGAVVYGGYSYHITENALKISKLSDGNPTSVGEIEGNWRAVFMHGETLALVKTYYHGDDPMTAEPMTSVSVFSLEAPANPAKIHETELSGNLTAYYLGGSNLYILTSDGECACGWSRLDDKSKYIPSVICDGKKAEVSNIEILGSPTAVKYLAVTKISMDSGEYLKTNTYYGDIEECFYSDGNLTAEVKTGNTSELYFFKDEEFKGRLSAGFDVENVTESEDVLRITGTAGNKLAVMTADANGAVIDKKTFAERECAVAVNEIINEENRQIISLSHFDRDRLEEINSFAFVTFDGGKISVFDDETQTDYVNGIDMIYAGRPFGEITSGIMLENGIFARYNKIPNAIDLFDFSCNKAQCVYDAPDMLGNGGRFGLGTFDMGNGKFAVTALFPGKNEQGETDYRDAYLKSYLYIYEFDGEKLRQIKSVPIPSYQNAEVFEADGIWYCTTPKSTVPTVL